MKIINGILLILFFLGSVALALQISEKVILIYEYGFLEVFEKGIYFEQTDPIITSEGDTLSNFQGVFHFLFTIVPLVIILFISAAIGTYISEWRKK